MKLEVAVAEAAECEKDISVEVAADEVQAQFNQTLDAYARHVKVPGFRPGRVPRNVVKQRYAKDIKEEVIGQIVPHALQHAIADHKLRVVGSPEINPDEISVAEGQPLRFKAHVTVLPEIELKPYKGLKATKRVVQVTDASVAKVLEELRERGAQLVPVEDRPAQVGDHVSVNLVGQYVIATAAHEEEDLKADDVVIELGAEGVQPEFNEHLMGVKAGDVRQFRVAYPEDFPSQGLAGKTLDFTANVVAVRQKEVPELDDDFAQEVGEQYQTLDELKGKIREDLEKQAAQDAEQGLRDSLVEQLVAAYDFPLPEKLVENQTNERLGEFVNRLMRSGMPPQAAGQINWEQRKADERLRAVRDVRTALVIENISDAERIEVGESELEAEIAHIAAHNGLSVDDAKARLTKEGGLASIENRLRYQKVIDLVVGNAEVVTEEIPDNQVTENPATGEAGESQSGDHSAETK